MEIATRLSNEIARYLDLDTRQIQVTTANMANNDVNTLISPTGQAIQLNVPGNQVFNSPSGDVLGTLNSLVADFASGTANGGVPDLASLNTALNYVSQQRVTIDNSLTRVDVASNAASSEAIRLTAVQTNLMQADIPAISTQLSLSKSQQTALINVIAALGSGSLFDKL